MVTEFGIYEVVKNQKEPRTVEDGILKAFSFKKEQEHSYSFK